MCSQCVSIIKTSFVDFAQDALVAMTSARQLMNFVDRCYNPAKDGFNGQVLQRVDRGVPQRASRLALVATLVEGRVRGPRRGHPNFVMRVLDYSAEGYYYYECEGGSHKLRVDTLFEEFVPTSWRTRISSWCTPW